MDMPDFTVRAIDPEAPPAATQAFNGTEHGRGELQLVEVGEGNFQAAQLVGKVMRVEVQPSLVP